jgi:hypothetical protein
MLSQDGWRVGGRSAWRLNRCRVFDGAVEAAAALRAVTVIQSDSSGTNGTLGHGSLPIDGFNKRIDVHGRDHRRLQQLSDARSSRNLRCWPRKAQCFQRPSSVPGSSSEVANSDLRPLAVHKLPPTHMPEHPPGPTHSPVGEIVSSLGSTVAGTRVYRNLTRESVN